MVTNISVHNVDRFNNNIIFEQYRNAAPLLNLTTTKKIFMTRKLEQIRCRC